MEQWYALYTKPQREGIVTWHLQKRGFHTLLPCYVERLPNRPPRTRLLFPCYLFAQVDLERWGLPVLEWIPGLREVVSFGGIPAHMPDQAIALVRQRLAAIEACGGYFPQRFQPGERVRIVEGPLAGLEAIFEGPLEPAERARVLIQFLGEIHRASVPAGLLERPIVRETTTPAADGKRERPDRRSRRTRGRGRRITRPAIGAEGSHKPAPL